MPLLNLILAFGLLASVRAEPFAEFGHVRIRLATGPNGETLAQSSAAGIATQANDGTISIQSPREPVLVESAHLPGWKIDVPAAARVTLSARLPAHVLEITHVSGDHADLLFPDSARAQMNLNSSAVFELFEYGTYTFRASTNVTGTSADGLIIRFSELDPWLTGGPLREEHFANGNTRFARSSPAISLEFRGSVESDVRVFAENSSTALLPDQERLLSLSNGSSVLLKVSTARHAVEWRVVKGLCHLRVADFTCWHGIAGSGQSGFLRWNPAKKIVDLGNTSGNAILARLTGRVTASITPGATFQYAQFQDCGSFVTSASGAEVYLYERDTGEVTPVLQRNVAFSEGLRRESAGAQKRWTPLSFSWDTDERIQVRGPSGMVPVASGAEQTIRLADSEMHVTYARNGDLTLRAAKGNFEVKPSFIDQFSMELPESAAVVMNIHRRRWLFTARAAQDSGAVIRALAAGQTYMFLSGGAKISVNLGQNSFFPEGSPSWIFFEGAGGETDFARGPQPGQVLSPDNFEASRIPQQPVSVIE